MKKITLIKDTIDEHDIGNLINWLQKNPRLTKGDYTIQFEQEWSKWLGVKFSVFVNSGSSANLASIYSLYLSGKLKNKKVVIPAVSWATTVSPIIQLGLDPIMCDCDRENLGLDINSLQKIIEFEDPGAIILVHVLGVPNKMDEIIDICKKNNILLVEDTCESIGSMYRGKKLGNFGDISTFSFYFGHHMSTIEGGMISTDNEELYHILLSIRSHGWDRDLPKSKQKDLRKKYSIDDFSALYTFYYPGFNIRSTDLQAFIGLEQLKKINDIIDKRNKNYEFYHSQIKNNFWKIEPPNDSFISNFAYPIISPSRSNLIKELEENNIECRPLICGSMSKQPFWYERYGQGSFPNSNLVHELGIYVPNNHQLESEEIKLIVEVINKSI